MLVICKLICLADEFYEPYTGIRGKNGIDNKKKKKN